jgi:hypothetical protein
MPFNVFLPGWRARKPRQIQGAGTALGYLHRLYSRGIGREDLLDDECRQIELSGL